MLPVADKIAKTYRPFECKHKPRELCHLLREELEPQDDEAETA
jgi:hypothetical protein